MPSLNTCCIELVDEDPETCLTEVAGLLQTVLLPSCVTRTSMDETVLQHALAALGDDEDKIACPPGFGGAVGVGVLRRSAATRATRLRPVGGGATPSRARWAGAIAEGIDAVMMGFFTGKTAWPRFRGLDGQRPFCALIGAATEHEWCLMDFGANALADDKSRWEASPVRRSLVEHRLRRVHISLCNMGCELGFGVDGWPTWWSGEALADAAALSLVEGLS